MQGRDKLLEVVEGVPLLRRQVLAALETGRPVVVLLPPNSEKRRAALDGLSVRSVEVTGAREGLSATLKVAASEAEGYSALAVLLPDVPGMKADDIQRVLNVYEAQNSQFHDQRASFVCVRATDTNGNPGTPIVFAPGMIERLEELQGDEGARRLLLGHSILAVPFDDDRATRDLDTPEDWSAWRRENERK